MLSQQYRGDPRTLSNYSPFHNASWVWLHGDGVNFVAEFSAHGVYSDCFIFVLQVGRKLLVALLKHTQLLEGSIDLEK